MCNACKSRSHSQHGAEHLDHNNREYVVLKQQGARYNEYRVLTIYAPATTVTVNVVSVYEDQPFRGSNRHSVKQSCLSTVNLHNIFDLNYVLYMSTLRANVLNKNIVL